MSESKRSLALSDQKSKLKEEIMNPKFRPFELPKIFSYFDDNPNPNPKWASKTADITDYFNYGFTEDSWKIYCQKVKKVVFQNSSVDPKKAELNDKYLNILKDKIPLDFGGFGLPYDDTETKKLDLDFTDKKIFHEFWGYSTIQEFIDKSLYPDEQNLEKTMCIEKLVKSIEEKTRDAVVRRKSPVKEAPQPVIPTGGSMHFPAPPHPDTLNPVPRAFPQPTFGFYNPMPHHMIPMAPTMHPSMIPMPNPMSKPSILTNGHFPMQPHKTIVPIPLTSIKQPPKDNQIKEKENIKEKSSKEEPKKSIVTETKEKKEKEKPEKKETHREEKVTKESRDEKVRKEKEDKHRGESKERKIKEESRKSEKARKEDRKTNDRERERDPEREFEREKESNKHKIVKASTETAQENRISKIKQEKIEDQGPNNNNSRIFRLSLNSIRIDNKPLSGKKEGKKSRDNSREREARYPDRVEKKQKVIKKRSRSRDNSKTANTTNKLNPTPKIEENGKEHSNNGKSILNNRLTELKPAGIISLNKKNNNIKEDRK